MTEIETETESFCRNPYNLTGICIWLSAVFSVVVCCYSEVLNLCMKSIERAHIPMNLWERIKLPRNWVETELLERLKNGIYPDIRYRELEFLVPDDEKNLKEGCSFFFCLSSPSNIDAASLYWYLFTKLNLRNQILNMLKAMVNSWKKKNI